MDMTHMNLDEAQKTLWLHQVEAPQTTQEALSRVSQALVDTINSFQADQLVSTQVYLEEVMAGVFVAMKTLNIRPSQALERLVRRMNQHTKESEPRLFHVYRDRVEICVGEDLRGGWPLYCHEDYENALAMANAFDCELVCHEAEQLDLFDASGVSGASTASHAESRVAPTERDRIMQPFRKARELSSQALGAPSRPKLTLVKA